MTQVSTFQRGFSLIEAIVVIAVSGIMLGAVAMFLRWPFQSYLDTARHGQLTDEIDTALRRIARELHGALPNSVRVLAGAGNQTCMEFLPTITGGRYRADIDSTQPGPPPANGDILDFTIQDLSFDAFGQFAAAQMVGNQVVVYNLGPSSPPADAYGPAINNNAALVQAVAPGALGIETNITFTQKKLFPLASPGNRFQVIGPVATGSVTYVFTCPPAFTYDPQGNGTGSVIRYVTPIAAAQTCPPAVVVGQPNTLADKIETCTVTYQPGPSATQREGVVSMQLKATKGNQGRDSATLYHEVHINNAP
jgi:MSHA biogenesis protein MshO